MVINCPGVVREVPERLHTGAVITLMTVFFVTGCQQLQSGTKKPQSSAPSPAPIGLVEDSFVHQLAQVDSVAVQVSPLDAAKADITISGLLHDGATQVQDIQQQKLADGFVITVTTARPKNATASLALIPFDRTISASLEGMPRGLCKVMVNGVATTFMIP